MVRCPGEKESENVHSSAIPRPSNIAVSECVKGTQREGGTGERGVALFADIGKHDGVKGGDDVSETLSIGEDI